MQCDDFLSRWHDHLDDRTDPAADTKLMDHAESCPACEAWLRDWQRLAGQFQSPTDKVQPRATAACLSTRAPRDQNPLRAQAPRRADRSLGGDRARPHASRWQVAMLGTAAAALFAIAALPTGNPTSGDTSLARRTILSQRTPAIPAHHPAHRAAASASGTRSADTKSAAILTLPTPLDIQRIHLAVSEPEWWGSLMVSALEPVDPITETIRPLTDSLQTALELLTPRSGSQNENSTPAQPDDASAHFPPRHLRFA